MKTIQVSYKDSGMFALSEDNEWVCAHQDAYIEKACCGAGTTDCGCYGRDSVLCPSIGCTGIQDWEINDLFETLGGM